MNNKKKCFLFIFTLVICLALTGCSKDNVLNLYNTVIQFAGNVTLTKDFSLEGTRVYGDDHYTGNYTADYKNFSGTEYLFGGTSIDRENGKDISVSCNLEITDGTAQVFYRSGNDEPVILLETDGSYSDTLTLPEGGNYIGITGNDLTGSLKLDIE